MSTRACLGSSVRKMLLQVVVSELRWRTGNSCVVLCWVWSSGAHVWWNSCYVSPASDPALSPGLVNAVFVWTVPDDHSCCCLRKQLLHFRLLSWCSQNSVLLKETLTWHISCQGVQTCDLSVMWGSVQPVANNAALPAWILMPHWS